MGRSRAARRSVPLYVVDAFAHRPFGGNPAAVMLLDRFPPDRVLRSAAAENNLAETAFVVPDGEAFALRWFTPEVEVPLCGHATLAAAAVLLERRPPRRAQVVFRTRSGELTVRRRGSGYVMDLPARPSEKAAPDHAVSEALGARPTELWRNEFNLLAIFPDERTVRGLRPDMNAVARLPTPGVIVSAPASAPFDFVSRYFAPAKGIPEDPVTGAAHCMLTPYWSARLGKRRLRAFQASRRGGELVCEDRGERVTLEGRCRFWSEGTVELPTSGSA